MKREPSRHTLLQMLGSDAPIGTYAEERMERALAKSENLEQSIDAIITYAEESIENKKNIVIFLLLEVLI